LSIMLAYLQNSCTISRACGMMSCNFSVVTFRSESDPREALHENLGVGGATEPEFPD
jgi:hypothetical protein